MNENAKKIGLIVIIVAAVVAAGLGAMRLFQGDKMEVQYETKMPANFKSEKQAALEAQQSGGGNSPAGGERDLSGNPTGG